MNGSLQKATIDFKEGPTGFETLLASMQGKSSKKASIAKVCSITGGLNRSLYFTEEFAHKIPTELLKTASIALLSAIRNRLMVPTKFIESMVILNELVLLFLKIFKVVFKAYPLIFIGLEEKLDEALAVASQVYATSSSYVPIFELRAQFGMDVSSLRLCHTWLKKSIRP